MEDETVKRAAWLLAIGMGLAVSVGVPGRALGQDLDDQMLTAKIRELYRLDPVVASTEIDIQTTAGIVTLRGTVPDMLAWGRAGLIAERVRGVRKVLNDLSVDPISRLSDFRINRDLHSALLTEGLSRLDQIKVNVDRGVVILSGSVSTWKQREDAARIARGIAGVAAIRNDLFVQGPTAYTTGYRGAEGTVPSGVPPFAVSVPKCYPPTDAALRLALEETLLRDVRVSSFRVQPQVVAGQVVLLGTVGNLVAKEAAEDDAWKIPGVRKVINRLAIEPTEVTSDARIFEDARIAVARDPYTGPTKVTVSVVNGTVYLFGQVDTELERNHATEIVGQVPGVVSVQNRLIVRPNSGPLATRRYTLPSTLNTVPPSLSAPPPTFNAPPRESTPPVLENTPSSSNVSPASSNDLGRRGTGSGRLATW